MNRDPRVDTYIENMPEWQKVVAHRIRHLIEKAEPEMVETIKRTNQPYYVFKGNVCALLTTKDHLNVFIYDPIASDPAHLINQGLSNKTARTMQLFENDVINEDAFVDLIRSVVKNNMAGGWRKL